MKKGDKVTANVEIVKVNNGVPTVIRFNGARFILDMKGGSGK